MDYTRALLKRPYPTTAAQLKADLQDFEFALQALAPYVDAARSHPLSMPLRLAYRDAQDALKARQESVR